MDTRTPGTVLRAGILTPNRVEAVDISDALSGLSDTPPTYFATVSQLLEALGVNPGDMRLLICDLALAEPRFEELAAICQTSGIALILINGSAEHHRWSFPRLRRPFSEDELGQALAVALGPPTPR